MSRFFDEIKRRKVTRVAIAYLIAAWLLIQVADQLTPILGLPDWVPKLVFLLLALGFVPALILAWAYELTPEGIRREAVESAPSGTSTSTGQYIEHAILGVVALAIIGSALYWFMGRDARWARNEALPQIEELIDAGEFETAYTLARKPDAAASPRPL